jgi:hypothetical protein
VSDRTFNVHMMTVASTTIPVVVTAEKLAEIAENLDVPVADLTVDDLLDWLIEQAGENTPSSLCHRCSGGNFASQASLELGDEWSTADEWLYTRGTVTTADIAVETTETTETTKTTNSREMGD